jgi:hypothetical protein
MANIPELTNIRNCRWGENNLMLAGVYLCDSEMLSLVK